MQDSVGLAIELENRYKGLRAPHKLKCAVSGCARECAEAQGKDFGIIATEKGWNLYVCGNGGMKPQHAELLAADLDEATLVRYIDRFLMFYIRTADRLQRTATWLNNLEGGIDYLRQVIVDDSLGIARRARGRHGSASSTTYSANGRRRSRIRRSCKRFRPFVNSDDARPSFVKRARQLDVGIDVCALDSTSCPTTGVLRADRRAPDRDRRARRAASTPSTTSIRSARRTCSSRGIVGDRARRAQDRLADLQAELRSAHRARASTIRRCAMPTYPVRVPAGPGGGAAPREHRRR